MAFEETGRGTTGRSFLHEGKMQDFYKIGKTLGEGSFAVVREVTCLKDNSKWAAKCIDKKICHKMIKMVCKQRSKSWVNLTTLASCTCVKFSTLTIRST